MATRKLAGAALHSHETKTSPAPPAPKGNQRGRKHGLRSEQALAPKRQEHIKALRADYPDLDDRRLALLADRLARIDLATAWLDAQKGIVRDRNGEVYAVVTYVEKWVSRAEAVLAEVERERHAPKRFDLAKSMSALEEHG